MSAAASPSARQFVPYGNELAHTHTNNTSTLNEGEGSAKSIRFHVTYMFRPRLAEYVLSAIKKGSHVLIEGSLISSTYEQPNGKSKKSKSAKITAWSIRADVVRKLDRGEPEPEATASGTARPAPNEDPDAPF